ncbi:MAG: hypothetical protein AAF633_04400 [Chloroflexota bacterium]
MATLTQSSNLLKTMLRGNAIFSELSGLTAALASGAVATFMGLPQGSTLVLIIIGVVLIGHGMILWFGSGQTPISPSLAWYAIVGDVGWVLGSLVILYLDPWSFSTGGWWLFAILADIVAVFAIGQYIGLRRYQI